MCCQCNDRPIYVLCNLLQPIACHRGCSCPHNGAILDYNWQARRRKINNTVARKYLSLYSSSSCKYYNSGKTTVSSQYRLVKLWLCPGPWCGDIKNHVPSMLPTSTVKGRSSMYNTLLSFSLWFPCITMLSSFALFSDVFTPHTHGQWHTFTLS